MKFKPIFRSVGFFCLAFTGILLTRCGNAEPHLEGIDLVVWRVDRNGCSGERQLKVDEITSQKEKLLALDELEIVHILGNPDQQELSKRNQKFYYYYLEPSNECAGTQQKSTPMRLAIRFNAMGLAKEIRVEEEY